MERYAEMHSVSFFDIEQMFVKNTPRNIEHKIHIS